MSDAPPQPTVGRARGRARGRALRPQGETAPGVATTPGRGRGVSSERPSVPGVVQGVKPPVSQVQGVRPPATGVQGVRPQVPATGAGRALNRGGAGATPSEVSALGSALSSVQVSTSSSAGESTSKGRGATRGRREERPTECYTRTRPKALESKKGSQGTAVDMSTNYFSLSAKPDWRLLQYRVDMKPEVDNTRVRKALFYVHKGQLGKFMFDGTMMFTTSPVTPDPLVLTSKRDGDGGLVTITVKLVGEVQPSDYHYMQFFNIVLRSAMEKMKLELIRRDYFDPQAAVLLQQYKLELWPGYVTSIRQHENKVLLCCEISHKILRTDTVLDQIEEVFSRTKGGPSFHSSVEKVLLGAIVITRYNNRTYRIDEIAWDKCPTDEFEGKNGEKTSYLKYYTERYNKSIRDVKQPLIVSMPKVREERSGVCGPVYLIPELCNMTGLSDEQRANFQLMKAMGDYTRQDPVKRSQTLAKFAKRINSKETQDELQAWNLKFSEELETFRARILAPETILGGGSSKQTYSVENADWSAAFRKWTSVSVGTCTKWCLLHTAKDEEPVKEFVNALAKVAPGLGMTMGKPKLMTLADNRPATYIQNLDKAIDIEPNLVMCVIPNNKGDHYAAIKKKCCVEKPVPSQVVTSTILGKPKGLLAVATKVALQMNCKLGGEPWAVKVPLKDTMVIGYDTYHDSAQKGRSVGAVVASLNSTFTKYLSVANLHTNPAQELNDNICPAITKALRKYYEVNKAMPNRIIMYRDGVGEGQINYVVEHEIAAIEACLAKQGLTADKIKFTYVIVSKRINTRFFRMAGGKPSNPPSGAVVDDVVTLPERYDFFLISQSVRQGTVNPTSYNVIKDTSGLPPDRLQQLTYKLTHLYYNWPGTVRVPAPCQYAHKLAFLVGESLHREPAAGLEEVLFYL